MVKAICELLGPGLSCPLPAREPVIEGALRDQVMSYETPQAAHCHGSLQARSHTRIDPGLQVRRRCSFGSSDVESA